MTESSAVWLSRVTARGVASTSLSVSLFRNESTALTPSAFRKAVAGIEALGGIHEQFAGGVAPTRTSCLRGTARAAEVVAKVDALCSSVPDQSIPLIVLGLREVS